MAIIFPERKLREELDLRLPGHLFLGGIRASLTWTVIAQTCIHVETAPGWESILVSCCWISRGAAVVIPQTILWTDSHLLLRQQGDANRTDKPKKKKRVNRTAANFAEFLVIYRCESIFAHGKLTCNFRG